MKRLILALLLIPTFACADIAILLRNGAIIHWSETGGYYSKEEESLCKGEYDRFCINQINIIGIAVGDREKLPSERMGEMDVDPLILPLYEARQARAGAAIRMEILEQEEEKRQEKRKKEQKQKLKVLGAMAKGWSQGWNQYEDYNMRQDIADIKKKLSKIVDRESIFGKEVEIRPKYDYDPSNRLRGNIDSSGYGTLRDSNLNRYEVRPRW